LTAYSWRNIEVGYCQSMNIICSLLLIFMNEEAAFWVLATICEDLVPEYYRPAMMGGSVDQSVFEFLIGWYFPNLQNHLRKLDGQLALLSLPWFLCLFIDYIPMQCALRVIDSFLLEGPNILFKYALAVIKLNLDGIAKIDIGPEFLTYMQDKKVDIEKIMQYATENFMDLPIDKIEEIRSLRRREFIKSMEITYKTSTINRLAQSTKFDRTELSHLYDKFHSYISNYSVENLLDVQKFKQLFNDSLPDCWEDRPDLQETAFLIFDKKGANVISAEEFILGLDLMKNRGIKEKLKFCIDIILRQNGKTGDKNISEQDLFKKV